MRDLLTEIVNQSAPPEASEWLRKQLAEQDSSFRKHPFYYAFSGVSRHFPRRGGLVITPEQSERLGAQAAGLSLAQWDVFRLARVLLLLALARQEKSVFLETITALLNTADLREQTAIFSAYPLLPHQDDLVESAIEGLRSNIVDVFDSIALGNPFPAARFATAAWNQMVLKAIFISRPLYRITGLEQRRNGDLAAAISNLAHERWAAGRRIAAEAWRNCVGFVDDEIAADLHHLLETGEVADREAAALVLVADGDLRLADLRGRLEGEIDAIGAGTLSWDRLGEKLAFPVNLNGAPLKS